MSIDMQVYVVSYSVVALFVLVGSALMLDMDRSSRDNNRRYKAMSERERIWVGRAGLACLLWPLMGVGIVVYVIYVLLHTLIQAARGKE